MNASAALTRTAETSRLRRLNDLADRIAADVWLIEADDRGTFVVADRFSGQRVTLCKFGQRANDDEIRLISEARDFLLFALPLLDRAATRVRDLEARVVELVAELDTARAAGTKPKDFAAQASMLLTNPKFQRFLSERQHGEIIDSKDAADAALKTQLGITSKKQINADARAAWLDFRAEFSAWETGALE